MDRMSKTLVFFVDSRRYRHSRRLCPVWPAHSEPALHGEPTRDGEPTRHRELNQSTFVNQPTTMKQHVIDHTYALLSRRTPDWSLDQPFYVDQDIFDLEMKLFLGRQWLFAALACEIPQEGDWVRVDIGRESIVIVRRKDGGIGAYHNTCRHRGSRISLEERGHASHLVCPYHQWTYDLNGKLVGARLMGSDFDKSAFQLTPVSVGLAGGHIYVSFAAEPPDFESFRRAVEPYMLPHQLENTKVA